MPDRRALARRRGLVVVADDREFADVLAELDPYQRERIERAVSDAYSAGEREADDRSARFVARCVAALVGLPFGEARPSARETLGRLRSLLSSRD